MATQPTPRPTVAVPPNVPRFQPPAPPGAPVVVTDVQIPFGSLVVLLVKVALAAIPAMIILFMIGSLATFLLVLIGAGRH